jgi:hypothetical protein
MKYQGLTAQDAKALMLDHGKYMIFYLKLFKQVEALSDFIAGRACSQKVKYCVIE